MNRLYVPVAAVAAFALRAAPAFAQETAQHAVSQGLPQLDVALYPGMLFWMAVCFFAFFALMSAVGARGIRQTLERRQAALDADLDAARAASDEAAALSKAYESDLHDARLTAQTTVAGIIAAASREAMAQSDKQEAELKHRMVVAQENIAQAKEQALKETQPYINDLVQLIVGRVMQADKAEG